MRSTVKRNTTFCSGLPTIYSHDRNCSQTISIFLFKFPAAIKAEEAKISRSEILVEKEKKIPDYSNGNHGNLNDMKSDNISDDNSVNVNVSSDSSKHTNITTIST